MNKKIITSLIVAVIILIATVIIFVFSKASETYIKAEIEKAKYCEINSDCVDAGGKCPFDCWVYVNKNEVERISNLIDSYNSKCIYGCINCPTAICSNNRCKAVCEK